MTEHPNDRLFHDTSRILVSALTFPGRTFSLPLGEVSTITALATIANALLNDETTFYTPDISFREYISRTGAAFTDGNMARYHFYPEVNDMVVEQMVPATTNAVQQPEQATTIFVGCKLREQVTLHLTGPGIPDAGKLTVERLPLQFWEVRHQAIQRPLGWDIYLVDGGEVVGLPHTTVVEITGSKS